MLIDQLIFVGQVFNFWFLMSSLVLRRVSSLLVFQYVILLRSGKVLPLGVSGKMCFSYRQLIFRNEYRLKKNTVGFQIWQKSIVFNQDIPSLQELGAECRRGHKEQHASRLGLILEYYIWRKGERMKTLSSCTCFVSLFLFWKILLVI